MAFKTGNTGFEKNGLMTMPNQGVDGPGGGLIVYSENTAIADFVTAKAASQDAETKSILYDFVYNCQISDQVGIPVLFAGNNGVTTKTLKLLSRTGTVTLDG